MTTKELKTYMVEYDDGMQYHYKRMKAFSKFELLQQLQKEIPHYSPFNINEIQVAQSKNS